MGLLQLRIEWIRAYGDAGVVVGAEVEAAEEDILGDEGLVGVVLMLSVLNITKEGLIRRLGKKKQFLLRGESTVTEWKDVLI